MRLIIRIIRWQRDDNPCSAVNSGRDQVFIIGGIPLDKAQVADGLAAFDSVRIFFDQDGDFVVFTQFDNHTPTGLTTAADDIMIC